MIGNSILVNSCHSSTRYVYFKLSLTYSRIHLTQKDISKIYWHCIVPQNVQPRTAVFSLTYNGYCSMGLAENKFKPMTVAPFTGDIVLALYTEDGYYYRALVKEVCRGQ